jgi:hypothetical protein
VKFEIEMQLYRMLSRIIPHLELGTAARDGDWDSVGSADSACSDALESAPCPTLLLPEKSKNSLVSSV